MPNRLASSSSPYLRQHQDNPVDWWPWCDEALALARAQDRPVLLSVGYSACHWCHVMAHESFEDPAIAALMNQRFVNIKVDREERPDLDAIYQKVVQLLSQGGGWPLTVFLTPAGEPIYGGTYFPPAPRHGRPSFAQVLDAIHDLWTARREQVATQVASFREGMAAIAGIVDDERAAADDAPALDDPEAARAAARRLLERVDARDGGFGRAPKFPNPTALEILATIARGPAGDELATACGNALRLTLDRMYEGGIYDHLRGGFARYSTDREWLVPHFEKMLYDNAQLLPLYAEAAIEWPEAEHLARVAHETVAYLVADMRTSAGTFFAATDADSEGEEGKYFCWTPAEVAEVVGDAELARRFCEVYGVAPGGNFEHGRSILHLMKPLARCVDDDAPEVASLLTRLQPARERLLAHRATRVPPLRDEKVLTSWNALLARGLIRAAAALSQPSWVELARACVETLCRDHLDAEGRVLRSGFEGRVQLRGVLDDVAALACACLDLHEVTLAPRWLAQAEQLAAQLVDHFVRPQRDGFDFTPDDGEALIERSESQHDGPLPSGVALAIELLLRLDASDHAPPAAREILERTLDRFRGASKQPFGYASLLQAARLAAPDAVHVKLFAPSHDDADVQALRDALQDRRRGRSTPLSWTFVASPRRGAVVCRQQTCTSMLGDRDAVLAAIG
ncbi:MAG: thioredoxin domain-containing protein [Deltaproteobacteria bacterium]|nr:thioredoxin domain-containing protein [Deltaproteobacteria bacterium]